MVASGDVIPDSVIHPDYDAEATDVISVRRLMWLRFKRNRLALIGSVVLVFMYLAAIFAGFIGPYALRETHEKFPASAPLLPRFIDEEGTLQLPPLRLRDGIQSRSRHLQTRVDSRIRK